MLNMYEIQKKVTLYSDLNTKLSLRKVNQSLRTLVDKDDLIFTELFVVLSEDMIRWGYQMLNGNRGMRSYDKENHKDRSFITKAAHDVCEVLSNAHAQIREFNIDVFSLQWEPMLEGLNITSRLFFTKMDDHLSRFTEKIHVESLRMMFDGNQSAVMSILPYLVPEVLTNIHFCFREGSSERLVIDRIADLEVFQRAKKLVVQGITIQGSIKVFKHFHESDVIVADANWDEAEYLFRKFYQNPSFQYCRIKVNDCEDGTFFHRLDRDQHDENDYVVGLGQDGLLQYRWGHARYGGAPQVDI